MWQIEKLTSEIEDLETPREIWEHKLQSCKHAVEDRKRSRDLATVKQHRAQERSVVSEGLEFALDRWIKARDRLTKNNRGDRAPGEETPPKGFRRTGSIKSLTTRRNDDAAAHKRHPAHEEGRRRRVQASEDSGP